MVAITRRVVLGVALLLIASIAPVAPGSSQGPAIECVATTASPASGKAPASAVVREVAFPEGGGELTVFAAASLTDALERVKTDLEAAYPGLTIAYNFAGSQTLVTQLKEGAAADVFAAANDAQMQAAIDNGSIMGEPVTFVRNRLVIVAPADNPAGLESPADLAKPDLRLVLAQTEVPAGRYSRDAICAMAADTVTYGEGFVKRVAANIVSEEEDVREVLAKVALGEADAGIVYVTDAATASDAVQLIDIPDAVNVVATYPIAAVTGGDEALASAFIAYIMSPDGQTTLADFGFASVS